MQYSQFGWREAASPDGSAPEDPLASRIFVLLSVLGFTSSTSPHVPHPPFERAPTVSYTRSTGASAYAALVTKGEGCDEQPQEPCSGASTASDGTTIHDVTVAGVLLP
jgi:hypothetical protein